jgi:hypothetical protein
MSTSSDLMIGDTFKDKVYIIETATGNAWAAQAPTCTLIDESGNRSVNAVVEESNGWYTSTFSPDASGTWSTEWALAGATIYFAPKIFRVGQTAIHHVHTDTTDILADTNELELDWKNGGRLDVILDVAQGNTTSILAATDVATSTRLPTTDFAVPAQNAVGNVDVSDVVGNKTDAANVTANQSSVVGLLRTVTGDTPYIADLALPSAPTASSLASRLRAISVLETTIGPNNRSTTSCELVAGDPHNSAYVNMIVVLDNNETNLNYVSRTVTAYTGASKTITWTPALTHDAVDGGKIWLCSNDTKINVTADAIKARTDHNLITHTFFSPSQIEVVADTTHTDAALPSVTLPNITGTIVSVYAGFKFRMIENTNAAVNKLSGAQEIQVRTDAPGAWDDCISLVDDQFGLAASTREGGDCIIGDIDVIGTVTAFNDIYEFQWDEPLTDQNALHFNDVQTFLIVSYY